MIELPNRSMNAREGFELFPDDIRIALELIGVDGATIEWEKVTLWHSHPGGGVGPSHVDMRHKLPRFSHLVVTLTPDEAIPTWY